MKRIVVVAIQHPEHKELYLHGKRKDSGKLTMPGGHCEPNEDIKAAAARELKEETGCAPADLKHLSTTVITKPDGRKMEVNLFSAEFKDELHIPHNNEDPDSEFGEYEWVDPTRSKDLQVKPKDNVLVHHINGKLKKSENAAAEKETEQIKENSKKPENQKSHKFQPAKWTHLNGHPRCIKCGGEERTGGICEPSLNKKEKIRIGEDGYSAQFAANVKAKIEKSDEICMPAKNVVKEHEKLVNVLKHPTKEKLKEEAEEQSGELKEYKQHKTGTRQLIKRLQKKILNKNDNIELSGNSRQLRKDTIDDINEAMIAKVPTMDRGDLAWHAENESSPKLMQAIYDHLVQSNNMDAKVLSGLAHNNNTPDDVVRKVINHSVSLPEDTATRILLNVARRHELPEDIKDKLTGMPHNQVQAIMATRGDLSDHQYDQLASKGDRWIHDGLITNSSANTKPHVIEKILDKSNDPRMLTRTISGGLQTGTISPQYVHELAKKHNFKDHPKLISAIADVNGVLPETLDAITDANPDDDNIIKDIAFNPSANSNIQRKLLNLAANKHSLHADIAHRIADHSTDPKLLHDMAVDAMQNSGRGDPDRTMSKILGNANTSADTIRAVKDATSNFENDHHYYNNTDRIAAHTNTPHDILKEIAADPAMDESTAYKLLNREDIHPDIAEAIDKNPSPSLKKEKDKAGYGNLVHTSMGTNKFRQARDMAEANPDQRVHINDLKQAGIHPSDLGFMHLKEKGDKFHADKLHEHIQNQPKMSYGVSHTTYGEEPEIADEESERDAHWDNYDPSDYGVNKEDFLDTDKAREYHMEQFDLDQYVDRDDPKYTDEQGNFNEDEYDADEESARVEHDQNFDPEDYKHLVHEDDDYVDQRAYDRAEERAYDAHSENFRPSGVAEEDAYNSALQEQRHTHEPSNVFQLNVTPQHKAQMKKEGVLDTFNRMIDASKYSAHPVHDNTIGWARYTEKPSGVHIDEIQSDFGQSFLRQASQQAKAAAQRGEMTPEQASEAVKNAEKKYPDEHFQKISNILFGGRHPNEVIHEAFLQHQRDKGKAGTPVHIWQPEGKAPISGMKTHDAVTWRDIENHLQDPQKGSAAAKSWIKEHKIKDLEHAKAKFDTQRNTFGEVQVKRPLPGHMQATYGQQPAKMGYKPSSYGKLGTQHNPDLQGQPTWESVIRKKEQYFATLAKNLKLRPKAPSQAVAQAKIDANKPQLPKPKRPSPIAVLSAQKAAKAKAKEILGKEELDKGALGDWQKEGYTIHKYPADKYQGSQNPGFKMVAKDRFGNNVAHAHIVDRPKAKHIWADGVWTDDDHRRKGLASALYAHAEKHSGKKMRPDKPAQMSGGKALWAQPNRPFGKSEPLQILQYLETLEKAELPIRSGQLSQNGKYISVKNPFGAGKDLHVWHNIQPIADAHDRDVKAKAGSFLAKQPEQYQPLMADFIKEHYNDPHRHIVSDSPKGFKFRARHLKSLLSGDPSVRIKYTSPDSFSYEIDRHNEGRGITSGVYKRPQKGMIKNETGSRDEYTILRRAIGETILEHGREGPQRHELGRIYLAYKNVRPEGYLRDAGRSGQPIEAPWDGILSKSGPDESQSPIRRFKNHAELEHHLSNNPFVMMTVHRHDKSPEDNAKAQKNLVQDILSRGYKITPTLGRWGGHDEPSLMIHDMSEDDARELARRYGQDAHLQSDKGIHRDISHSPNYKALKPGRGHMIQNDLTDNYSIMELGDGSHAKFQLNLDNLTPEPNKP